MKIAIAQTEICFEEPEKNLRTAESWIEQAAQEGADAIFFPEMSFTGFSMHVEKVAAYANPIRQTMCPGYQLAERSEHGFDLRSHSYCVAEQRDQFSVFFRRTREY